MWSSHTATQIDRGFHKDIGLSLFPCILIHGGLSKFMNLQNVVDFVYMCAMKSMAYAR